MLKHDRTSVQLYKWTPISLRTTPTRRDIGHMTCTLVDDEKGDIAINLILRRIEVCSRLVLEVKISPVTCKGASTAEQLMGAAFHSLPVWVSSTDFSIFGTGPHTTSSLGCWVCSCNVACAGAARGSSLWSNLSVGSLKACRLQRVFPESTWTVDCTILDWCSAKPRFHGAKPGRPRGRACAPVRAAALSVDSDYYAWRMRTLPEWNTQLRLSQLIRAFMHKAGLSQLPARVLEGSERSISGAIYRASSKTLRVAMTCRAACGQTHDQDWPRAGKWSGEILHKSNYSDGWARYLLDSLWGATGTFLWYIRSVVSLLGCQRWRWAALWSTVHKRWNAFSKKDQNLRHEFVWTECIRYSGW